MIKIGDYEADRHSYHHPDLGTDLQVIQQQSIKAAQDKYYPHSSVVHHHLSTEPCKVEGFDNKEHDNVHEVYPIIPSQRVGD